MIHRSRSRVSADYRSRLCREYFALLSARDELFLLVARSPSRSIIVAVLPYVTVDLTDKPRL